MRYGEKLKDPRWQKLRLKVFERDEFKCVACGDSKTTLHVHHKAYNADPWDADLGDLATLCEECHSNLEEMVKMVRSHPEIRALPHIINRTIMLAEIKEGLARSLLRCAISLQKMSETEAINQASEGVANFQI